MSDHCLTPPARVVSANRSTGASPDALSAEELVMLRQRLAQGFYQRLDVIALIAGAVQPEVDHAHGD
jgi:hypothetical protein